jgi:hypothetical protein
MANLINDTTQTGSVSASSKKFTVRRGEVVALRSTNMDGTGVVTLYYDGPDGTFNGAVDDNGNAVTLTPTNPERIVNVPGDYRVAVTSAATTQGVVFVNGTKVL